MKLGSHKERCPVTVLEKPVARKASFNYHTDIPEDTSDFRSGCESVRVIASTQLSVSNVPTVLA